MRKLYAGRHLYGFAAIAFGIISFCRHDFGAPWQQIQVFGSVPHRLALVYLAAAVEIFGGIAIQWRKTTRTGALALGAIFLVFALLWIPLIFAQPHVYDRYANFFEQLSIVSGALIVYGAAAPNAQKISAVARVGYFAFALCVVSFTLDHIFYLKGVAAFVPAWIPPSRMFWAVATTIAFALAAIALFSGRQALLAARLLTIMILSFTLLIWLPRLVAGPHQLMNWAGNAQNAGIAGAAWIVADYLRAKRTASMFT